MGKGGKHGGGGNGSGGGKRSSNKYVHKHTYNPKARESDERKIEQLKNIEVKRCQKHVDHHMALLQSYVPLEVRNRKPTAPDPAYFLKGAARVAQEFYRPPGYKEDAPPVDIIDQYKGRLWECGEAKDDAQTLLRAMNDLSVALHSTKGKTKAAIDVLKQMLDLDAEDHLFARHRLLRCYLDMGEAGEARALLDRFADDTYCCMIYSRALIECISMMLEEEDASEEAIFAALQKAYDANPWALWTLIHHEAFGEVLEDAGAEAGVADSITDDMVTPGSILDAVRFADVDVALWLDTDGAIDHVIEFVRQRGLQEPTMDELEEMLGGDDDGEGEGDDEHGEDGDDDGDGDGSGDDYDDNEGGEGDEEKEDDGGVARFEGLYAEALSVVLQVQ